MTGRVGEYKREDKDDAPRPGVRVSIPKKGFKPKKAILFLSITVASGLLMVSVYNSLVDAESWGFDIPPSIQRPETMIFLAVPSFFPGRNLRLIQRNSVAR